jgi:uncharacterized protein
MTYIRTRSGIKFDYVNPTVDMIISSDIALGLSNTCRFAGQCSSFYSVAQHSVLVSELVEPQFAVCALLHDASEAYMTDIPRPLKKLLPDYKLIEDKVMSVISEKFKFDWPMPEEVKVADNLALAMEAYSFMPRGREDEYGFIDGSITKFLKAVPMSAEDPVTAMNRFYKRALKFVGNW